MPFESRNLIGISGVLLLIVFWSVAGDTVHAGENSPSKFFRMDPNIDGSEDISDAVFILEHLFGGLTIALDCEDSADVNDDGTVNLSDAISILFYLFQGWLPPNPVPPDCDVDQTEDRLGCEQFWPCNTIPPTRISSGMDFIYVHPGTFLMGSPSNERGRNPFHATHPLLDETLHDVTFTYGFYLSATEVTQAKYLQITAKNPSTINGGVFGVNLARPVDNVSWWEAVNFCQKLSKLDGRQYRLPTEAEWEYACRAGTQTRFYFGEALDCDEADICQSCFWINEFVGFCTGEFRFQSTDPVGQKKPNPWGFFNMHDNATEWCLDWGGTYTLGSAIDPVGPSSGTHKIIRGSGGKSPLTTWARSAMRSMAPPGYKIPQGAYGGGGGFRIVLETGEKSLGSYPGQR